ncbi:hypothetical protein NFC81_08750 [Salinispirillum sp. LH 10-3-1]|uniref:DUF1269 domain-containing protein n=1 Tax=Salinispirillum sp. LH 10-3-1 TaxID=2952525 RepID=A0AB38YCR5_9GAMM
MNEHRHHVSGFFAHREEAESTLADLVGQGFPRGRILIFSADSASVSPAQEEKSDSALHDVLVDGAIGTAAGSGLGALGAVALTASSVTLFIASPLIAPLVMIGWGASMGGLVGAAVGASDSATKKEGWLSDLVSDAIDNGQVVLVAETRNAREAALARKVLALHSA